LNITALFPVLLFLLPLLLHQTKRVVRTGESRHNLLHESAQAIRCKPAASPGESARILHAM
jgi:hypothetical protein